MTAPVQRLRVTFAKGAAIRFTSHLDLVRVWVRSLRRAKAPLAYTQGFNPRPRLQLAAALPLGHTAGAELLDVWLVKREEPDELRRRLPGALVRGIEAIDVGEVGLKEPALQTQVVSACYRVAMEWGGEGASVEDRVAELLAAGDVPVVRKGKTINLRPLVESLTIQESGPGRAVLEMQLAASPGRTGRAEDVVEALELGGGLVHYHRSGLLFADS